MELDPSLSVAQVVRENCTCQASRNRSEKSPRLLSERSPGAFAEPKAIDGATVNSANLLIYFLCRIKPSR
jgi:hypothetical protein